MYKKILFILILLLSLTVKVFADTHNINAVCNESIAKYYIINDTNLTEFKNDLKNTHTISVGYYSEVTGYLDFTNVEVNKSGYDNYEKAMLILNNCRTFVEILREWETQTIYNVFYFNSQSKFRTKTKTIFTEKSQTYEYYIEVK